MERLNWLKYNLLFTLLMALSPAMSQEFIHLTQLDRKIAFDFADENGFMVLKVQFNNVLPLQFIFDTGSENTILFKKTYADLLGVTYDKKIPLLGADLKGPTYAHIARRIFLNIDNKMIVPSDILVLEENYFNIDQYTGTPIDGIIGANIYRYYVVYIDNKKNKIWFIPKDQFKEPQRFVDVPIDIQQTKILLNATTTFGYETAEIKLILDSGAALPVLLYTNTHEDFALPDNAITGNLGIGLGGFLEGYVGRINEFAFAEYDFNQMITYFQEVNLAHPNAKINIRNGILGNVVLSRFNYFIDYIHHKLYMKPNGRYQKRFRFDRSGLLIAATGVDLQQYVVQKVLPNSPAEEVDIRKGDVITKMKWIPSKFLNINAMIRMLSGKEGKKVNITINRNGELLKKRIILRNLI